MCIDDGFSVAETDGPGGTASGEDTSRASDTRQAEQGIHVGSRKQQRSVDTDGPMCQTVSCGVKRRHLGPVDSGSGSDVSPQHEVCDFVYSAG